MSNAYQQSSADSTASARIDPENLYCWRFRPRRLEAEAIRDCILSCSDRLDLTMFGQGSLDESMRRRSIYFTVKRSQIIPCMQLFDRPESLVSIGSRPSTTTAPQALFFMNSPILRSAAEGLAERLKEDATNSTDNAIKLAFQISLSRDPKDGELKLWRAMIDSDAEHCHGQRSSDAQQLALVDFCQLLLSTSEFLYIR